MADYLHRVILDDRFSQEQEYTLHLFEHCNLGCSYCWQDHDAKDGLDTIMDKLSSLEKWFKTESKSSVVLNIMGGEVFEEDIFDDKLFDTYITFADECYKLGLKYNIHVRVNWVSHLVVNVEKVLLLLKTIEDKGVPCSLSTSYDSKGRFNKKTKERWLSNIRYLMDHGIIPGVSMLFTKPVIKSILNHVDDTFDLLYQMGLPIYIDYYTPTTGYGGNQALLQANMPSDIDLLKAFVYLMDHYPLVQPINGLLTRSDSGLTCRKSKLILPDGTNCLCGNLHLSDPIVHFYKTKIEKDSNDGIEDRFVKDRDCIGCEHFSYCQMGCFMQHDFSKRTQLKDCLFRLTYQYAIDKKPIDFDQLETYFGENPK